MFPISTKKSLVLPNVNTPHTVKTILGTIEKELGDQRARGIRKDNESIAFRGGFFRCVSNWNLLGPITEGKVSVRLEHNAVRLDYELWFTQSLIFVSAGSCFMGVLGLCAMPQTPSVGVYFGLFVFAFLFGFNVVLPRRMFGAFLKECVGTKSDLEAWKYFGRTTDGISIFAICRFPDTGRDLIVDQDWSQYPQWLQPDGSWMFYPDDTTLRDDLLRGDLDEETDELSAEQVNDIYSSWSSG